MILIYSGQGSVALPADDPYDTNNDNVYVLPVTSSLFHGRLGQWDEATKRQDYYGSISSPSEQSVFIDQIADGAQVRAPSKEIEHGLSFGQTTFADENNFPLWVSAQQYTDANCWFEGVNPWLNLDFLCVSSTSAQANLSPGLPNSVMNADLVQYLLNCQIPDEQQSGTSSDQTSTNEKHSFARLFEASNTLSAYPNPFGKLINVNYQTSQVGKSRVYLQNSSGQILYNQEHPMDSRSGELELHLRDGFPSGIYLLSVIFPSGERKQLRMASVR